MKILGIETSCDETAAAVVEDGRKVLSNVVASQADLHAATGGVVPEVAARSHIEQMLPVVDLALSEAKISWNGIDGIAVTSGPGLLGSLLIGTLTAKTLAQLKDKPLYAINHVEAHAYAMFLEPRTGSREPEIEFPVLALIVSGGHTQLVLFKDHHNYRVLGATQDDAAGEAFDKVAKLLGLGYPGGPAIAEAAMEGDETAYKLPHARLSTSTLDFSYSGLKTAVLRLAQELYSKNREPGTKNREYWRIPSHEIAGGLTEKQKSDIAASFQKTIVDNLVSQTLEAYEKYRPKTVTIAGGVAANKLLRQELASKIRGSRFMVPDSSLCTDNAAMIAALGYWYAKDGKSTEPAKLEANPVLAM